MKANETLPQRRDRRRSRLLLLVVGAVLTFAVDVSTSGFNLNTVGIILMAAGALAPFLGRSVGGVGSILRGTAIARNRLAFEAVASG